MRHCQACLATDHDLRACPSRNGRFDLRPLWWIVFLSLVEAESKGCPAECPTLERAKDIEARAMSKLRWTMVRSSPLLNEERPRDMRLDPDGVPEDRSVAQLELL